MSPRHALTDGQWNRIEGLLPGQVGDPGQSGRDNRLFVDAVLFIAKTGVPWRDLPERFGNWNSIWRRLDRWSAKGVWECVVKELGNVDREELQFDSTSIKVHLAAVGGRRLTAERKKMPTAVAGSRARRPEYQAPRGDRRERLLGENDPDSGPGRRRPPGTKTAGIVRAGADQTCVGRHRLRR